MPRLQWTFKSNHSSVELTPLSLSYNVNRSYGSILNYFHFLKRLHGDTQVNKAPHNSHNVLLLKIISYNNYY